MFPSVYPAYNEIQGTILPVPFVSGKPFVSVIQYTILFLYHFVLYTFINSDFALINTHTHTYIYIIYAYRSMIPKNQGVRLYLAAPCSLNYILYITDIRTSKIGFFSSFCIHLYCCKHTERERGRERERERENIYTVSVGVEMWCVCGGVCSRLQSK